MSGLSQRIIEFIQNSEFMKNIDFQERVFYFLFALKKQTGQFKVNINKKCLVFSQYPGAEIKGLGGLIAQYPKNFEVLCLTNGSNFLKEFDPVESARVKKQQFHEVMKFLRVKGFKNFDIDDNTLKNHYSTFRKIDISEVDYIFVPNLYDDNSDAIALLKHLKQLLEEKEHKNDLKIMMYESDFPLSVTDYYVNIGHIIETKKKTLKMYYPEEKFGKYAEKTVGLNQYRGIKQNCDYCEAFLTLSVQEFMKIPLA